MFDIYLIFLMKELNSNDKTIHYGIHLGLTYMKQILIQVLYWGKKKKMRSLGIFGVRVFADIIKINILRVSPRGPVAPTWSFTLP